MRIREFRIFVLSAVFNWKTVDKGEEGVCPDSTGRFILTVYDNQGDMGFCVESIGASRSIGGIRSMGKVLALRAV